MAKRRPSKAPPRSPRDSRPGGSTKSAEKRTVQAPEPERRPLAERILWVALLLIVVLVPIVWGEMTRLGNTNKAPFTFDQYDILKAALLWGLLAVAAAAWLWSALFDGRPVRWSPVYFLLLGFLGWVVVTTVFSIHPPTAFLGKYRRFEGLVAFFGYGVLLFLTVQVADTEARIRRITQMVVLSGTLVAFYGVLQYLGLDPIPRQIALPFESNRAYSTMGNPDLLGGFLIFPLAASLTLALAEGRRWWRLGYWACCFVVVGALVTSFTRGAWIAGAVVLIIMVFGAWRARVRPTLVDLVMAGLVLVAGLVVVVRSLGSTSEVTNVVSRLKSIFAFNEGSGQTRLEIWTSAVRGIKHSPVLGYGPDTFRLVFPRFKVAEYSRDAGYLSVADNAHSYPLQVASGMGIPGLLLLYGVFGWVLAGSVRTVFGRERGTGVSPLLGFWAATLGYLVYLMFGLSVTGSSFLLWMSLGLLVAPGARTFALSLRPLWRDVIVAVAGVSLVVFLAADVSFLMADHYYLRAKIMEDPASGLQEARRAVRLDPMIADYRAQISTVAENAAAGWFQEADKLRASGQDPTQALANGRTYFGQAVKAGKDAVRFVPPEFDNYPSLAQLYINGGQFLDPQYFNDALHWAEQGLRVEPNGLAAAYLVGYAQASLGRMDVAIPLLERTAAADPAFSGPRLLLGEIYQTRGDTKQAVKWLREAVRADPKDKNAQERLAALEASATK